MNDTDYKAELQLVKDELNAFVARKDELTKAERKQRSFLEIRWRVLGLILAAQEKGDFREEIRQRTAYGVISMKWAMKYPFITSLMLRKLNSQLF